MSNLRNGWRMAIIVWCATTALLVAQDKGKAEKKAALPAAKSATPKLPALDSAEEYVNRGDDLRQKQQFAQAKADFDAALKLDPENVAALVERSWTLAGLNRLRDALADANAAIKLNPKLPGVFCPREC